MMQSVSPAVCGGKPLNWREQAACSPGVQEGETMAYVEDLMGKRDGSVSDMPLATVASVETRERALKTFSPTLS